MINSTMNNNSTIDNSTTLTNGTAPYNGFVMPQFTGSWYLPADIPNIITLVLIAVLGMANLGLILCFVQAKSLRKPFNYILLGMAIGNFVMSNITSVMEVVTVVRRFVPVGSTWCYVLVFLRTFSFSQSMLFITLVAVIRAASGLSKHYVGLTVKIAVACVVSVYTLSLLWAGLWIMPGWGNIDLCLGILGAAAPTPLLLYLIASVVMFLITVCSYTLLLVGLRCKKAQSVALAGNKKSEILTLRAGVTVSVIFLLCYLLPFVPAVVKFTELAPLTAILHILHGFNSLACLQSALNPYVYLITNGRFRRIYVKSWRRFLLIVRGRRGEVSPLTVQASSVNGQQRTVQSTVQHLEVPHKSAPY